MSTKFSDEELTAYLDGEKEHTPYREIEQALKTDEALQMRLGELEISQLAISSSMDELLKSSPPAPPQLNVKHAANNNTPWLKGLLLASCAASIMLFSGIVGYSISDRQVDSWREYVAAYHYLYITNTLANVEGTEKQIQDELVRVGDAISKDFSLASLKDFSGLEYKRSQILGFEGKPLAQMTFLSKMGTPVALCIIRSGTHSEEVISNITMEGMASATWSKGGYEYLIIGGKDNALIDEAAKHFAASI